MKITALDIRQKQFKTRLRGLDPRQVEAFLELVAAELEDLVKQTLSLKDEIRRKQQKLDEYREREKTLQATLLTAQRMSDETAAAARKEAELIVSEAQLQAEKIVAGAHQKLVQLADDINELKRQRVLAESQLESLLDGHRKLLETFRAPRGAIGEVTEENVTFLPATGSEPRPK